MSIQKFTVSGLILAILAVVSFVAIAQADSTLTASISGPSTITVNEPANFNVDVTGGSGFYTYVWSFGEGEPMAGTGVTHTYTTAGTKTVNVVVTDTDSNQVSVSHTITVDAAVTPLVATITNPTNNSTFEINQSISFNVDVTGGSGFYTYVWSFGEGEPMAGTGVTHTYTTAGTKTVNVVVTDTDSNQVSTSVSINISGGSVTPAPAVTFTANGQTGSLTVSTTTMVTLAWTATDATSCSASDAWSGTKSLSGSETVGPFATPNSSRTYTLTCVGAGGTTVRNVVVATTADSNVDLVITNVRVTDVNNNSAIVRWETNLPASSRVIYDTVSHSSISGAAAPNYGYQFSTATDTALVTSHAVTVSGLASGTHYYFRVISEN